MAALPLAPAALASPPCRRPTPRAPRVARPACQLLTAAAPRVPLLRGRQVNAPRGQGAPRSGGAAIRGTAGERDTEARGRGGLGDPAWEKLGSRAWRVSGPAGCPALWMTPHGLPFWLGDPPFFIQNEGLGVTSGEVLLIPGCLILPPLGSRVGLGYLKGSQEGPRAAPLGRSRGSRGGVQTPRRLRFSEAARKA